jgi:cell division protein FtsI/penicillin-binding protein 2
MLLRRRDLWPLLTLGRSGAAHAITSAAILLRLADRKVVAITNPEAAASWLSAPGSTVKPLTLYALLQSGKLKTSDEYLCPGTLVLNGRNMSCSHLRINVPMNASRAIAYSCNCTVAHFAQRLEPGQLPRFFRRLGFGGATGLLNRPEAVGAFNAELSGEQLQLQALGETFIEITPLELLLAYAAVARRSQEAVIAPIIEGLEGAVEYGSAQEAKLPHLQVAAKTGSVRDPSGVHVAWLAGFAPSRSPEVAFTVLTQ